MTQDNLPLAIEIEINSECNLSCAYCPNAKKKRIETGHMSEDLFVKLMEQLRSHQYSGRISFHFYNEPTLSPQLERFISITRDYIPNAKTVLYSNGTGLGKEKIDSLYSAGLARLVITEHHQWRGPRMQEAVVICETAYETFSLVDHWIFSRREVFARRQL